MRGKIRLLISPSNALLIFLKNLSSFIMYPNMQLYDESFIKIKTLTIKANLENKENVEK